MENKIIGSDNEPLKIQFITDTHYYSRKNGTQGKAYDEAESKSQKVLKDADLVIKAGFDILCNDTSTDIVVLSGDTTKDGELSSHQEFIEMLRELKSRGKRVYVITATHDFRGAGTTDGYDGDDTIKVPTVKDRLDLWDMYYEFGPNEAISYHRPSMSYVVQLAPGYRLFALNDDTNGKDKESGKRGSGYSDECMDWILEQLKDAREHNQFVVAMTHHPMISPSPFYQIIASGDMQKNADITRNIFADNGLSCMLSGHTHIHNISYSVSEKGNRFYDIACGAMVGCPPVMRNVVIDPKNAKIDVDTIIIKDVPGLDTKEKPFDEYMRGFFFGMIKEVVWSMGYDINRLSQMSPAFSIPSKTIKKYGWAIKPVGKFLNKLTYKKVWKLCKKECGLTKEDMKDIKDKKVVDLILELIQNLYCGDSPYSPDTKEYKLVCGMLNVVDSFLDTIHLKIGKFLKGATTVRALVEPLLYNSGYCDDHATLPLFPVFDNKDKAPKDETKHFEDTVKKSKKGPLVLMLLILLVILLLAVVVGIVALIVWAIVAIVHVIAGTGLIGLLFAC